MQVLAIHQLEATGDFSSFNYFNLLMVCRSEVLHANSFIEKARKNSELKLLMRKLDLKN
jgi:hypothetical protein